LNYGKALRIARAASGLQQQELAQRAGLTPSYVSLVEMGKRNPSSATLRKLSRALQIPPHLLTLLAIEPQDADLIDQKEIDTLGDSLVRLLLRTQPNEPSSVPAKKRIKKRA
jgi:transcriptional regulator with XRE-family HTH domain